MSCASGQNAVGVVCGSPDLSKAARLVNGNHIFEGRVEIFSLGQWGTVCDDNWDLSEAQVICQQLGLGEAAAAARNAAFGPGYLPIFLDDLNCNGTEPTLLDCPGREIHSHNCHHNEDAGVVCKPTLRLVGSPSPNEGNLQIKIRNQWGGVCFDNFTIANGHVACRQLGFGPAISVVPSSRIGNGSDQVFLSGLRCLSDEAFLAQCQVTPDDDCQEQAAVKCSLPVRLVNGTSAYGGRVQIQKDGAWGGICDSHWTLGEANVVCRQLGLAGAMSANATLVEGTEGTTASDISEYRNYDCDGSEPTLMVCNNRVEFASQCNGVSVTCAPSVRLINGSNPYEGRVEILVNGTWGTVCDDMWDLTDAQVVCRQLGYGYARSAPTNAYFGSGTGPIAYDNVQCTGSEKLLSECSNAVINQHNCGHEEDAGVSCALTSVYDEGLRLVGGSSEYEGRVEVFWQGSWGTICDDDWDDLDATVICSELGFSGGTAALQAAFGLGTGPIILDNVQCDGDETSILNCPHSGFLIHNCGHSEDAGVTCEGSVSTTPGGVTVTPNTDAAIRLVGGDTQYEGRVEVLVNEEWGTVCDDLWDLDDGNVVCRQLGFGPALRAPQGADFGPGTGPIFFDNMECSGSESSLSNCRNNGVRIHNCQHSEDAGVECSVPGATPTTAPGNNTDGEIRLRQGKDQYEGRVEIFFDGEWGTVCDDLWDISDAQVVCRQLGFKSAIEATSMASFGRGVGPIMLDNMVCDGSEDELRFCNHNGVKLHNCGHSEDAGVRCSSNTTSTEMPEEGEIRLVNGENQFEGRVEVYYNSIWGTVCDDMFDLNEAQVTCAQLSFGAPTDALGSAQFGPGTGPIHLDNLACTGTEGRLVDCSHAITHNCNHGEDAGVRCSDPTEVNTNTSGIVRGSVRLVGGSGPLEGRVEVFIDEWGTVCDDLWNLDDGHVVCRQLGYLNATQVTLGSTTFGSGEGPILLDNVQCSGSEPNILSCPANEPREHNCAHSEDAGVMCYNAGLGTNGTVRFISTTASTSTVMIGIIQVSVNDQWGYVCNYEESWTIEEGMVVCRQLNLGYATRVWSAVTMLTNPNWVGLRGLYCNGSEPNLLQCRGANWGICTSGELVGVECTSTEVNVGVRLVGGAESNPREGRVEVFINNTWSTVCRTNWTISEATVVCHQLGFGPPINRSPGLMGSGLSSGPAPMRLRGFRCNETLINLFECRYEMLESPITGCSPAEVVCQQPDPGVPVTVRLAGGSNALEGRVEVYKNGEWGTVCDDGWDLQDGLVVCRQLGFLAALEAPGGGRFGAGTGPIHMDNVYCSGSEEQLLNCPYEAHNCGHTEDAGVVCRQEEFSTLIRLRGGSSDYEGRVEIVYNGVWGTVCDDSWEINDANVVCRQLGFGPAESAAMAASFGQGTGEIHLDNVGCVGTEETLQSCGSNGVGVHNCNHGEDAGVRCSVPTDTPPTTVRLVGGSRLSEGRVEVFWEGQWGTVCDDSWDILDAQVVCQELGYSRATSAPTAATYGQGTGRITLDNVACTGEETTLLQCRNGGILVHNCGHSEDAGAVCATEGPPGVTVRLQDGSVPTEGRVEIFLDYRWGTVCDDSWDMNDARVVCRQLGFHTALEAPGSAHFGEASVTTSILLDNVGCVGTESRLSDCLHAGEGVHNCGHAEDAGVVCSNAVTRSDTLRLVGTDSPFRGRVEVHLNNQWGTVCDDGWGLTDAQVVCRQLGFSNVIDYVTSAHFGRGTGSILLDDVGCTGTEETLIQCTNRGIGSHNCGHSEDAGVICMPEVRLANGSRPQEGRVEILIGGQWGTICNEGWDIRDANTICSHLGFGVADNSSAALVSAHFGYGEGPIHLTGVNCLENAAYLFECESLLTYNEDESCNHTRDVGVICSERSQPERHVRLVGGPTPFKGRTEVFYNNSWGTICDDYWDLDDASVFCRQLGHDGALEAPRYSQFGRGFGPIHLDDVGCVGNETDILDCPRSTSPITCTHREDAGAMCAPKVRLAGGNNVYKGRVEILIGSTWKGFCGTGWTLSNSRIICTQLGLGMVAEAPTGLMFGKPDGGIYMQRPSCGGYERSIGVCFMYAVENCTQEDGYAGAVCSLPEEDTKIRLVGGATPYEGRVEIGLGDNWGTVCSNSWDKMDANVICRQLGFAMATSAIIGSKQYGQGSGPIYLDNVRCTGSEANIALCMSSGVEVHNCSHKDDAGVICTPPVRLVGGPSPYEGRVEVYQGSWGTVCDDQWDIEDAKVVCRILGFGSARRVIPTDGYRQTYSTILMDEMQCLGNETSLFDCPYSPNHDCTHAEDAGVQCFEPDIPCDLPRLSQYSYISFLKVEYAQGEALDISCVDGSESVTLLCDAGGRWVGPAITCYPPGNKPQSTCMLPRPPPPGTAFNTLKIVFQVLETLEVYCEDNNGAQLTKITNSVIWKCQEDGTWFRREINCGRSGGLISPRSGHFNIPLFICLLLAIIAIIIIIVAVILVRKYRRERMLTTQTPCIGMENVNSKYSNVNYANPSYDPSSDPTDAPPMQGEPEATGLPLPSPSLSEGNFSDFKPLIT